MARMCFLLNVCMLYMCSAVVRRTISADGAESSIHVEKGIAEVTQVSRDEAWTNRVAKCIDPRGDKDLSKDALIIKLSERARDGNIKFHPETYMNPLTKLGNYLDKRIPQHWSLGLVTRENRRLEETDGETDGSAFHLYPDYLCYHHDYENNQNDDAGCSLFAESLKLLKDQHTCIRKKLRKSSVWTKYVAEVEDYVRASNRKGSPSEDLNEVAKCARKSGSKKLGVAELKAEEGIFYSVIDRSWGLINDEYTLQLPDKSTRVVSEKEVKKFHGFIEECRPYDEIWRADEMIKNVAFKDYPEDAAERKDQVERKLVDSYAGSVGSLVSDPDTISEIRKDCFSVYTDGEIEGGFKEAAKDKAGLLKTAMDCLPLMFDNVEVPGTGRPLVNANKGMRPNWHLQYYESKLIKDWPTTPAVCARFALSFIAESFTKTRFDGISKSCGLNKGILSAPFIGHYDVTDLSSYSPPTLDQCLNMEEMNCICFTQCFEQALKYVIEEVPACGKAADGETIKTAKIYEARALPENTGHQATFVRIQGPHSKDSTIRGPHSSMKDEGEELDENKKKTWPSLNVEDNLWFKACKYASSHDKSCKPVETVRRKLSGLPMNKFVKLDPGSEHLGTLTILGDMDQPAFSLYGYFSTTKDLVE